MSAKDIISDAKVRMGKAIDALHHDMQKVRTGRASASMLDSVMVEYYGQTVPISQAATVSVPEPRLIAVQPWEKSLLAELERAILKAELGLNPSNDGAIIRIPIPALNEERRKEMVKLVKQYGENAKVSVRNIRRDANDHLKKLEKANELSEDELSVELDEVQKLTEDHTAKVDVVVVEKEKEVMEI